VEVTEVDEAHPNRFLDRVRFVPGELGLEHLLALRRARLHGVHPGFVHHAGVAQAAADALAHRDVQRRVFGRAQQVVRVPQRGELQRGVGGGIGGGEMVIRRVARLGSVRDEQQARDRGVGRVRRDDRVEVHRGDVVDVHRPRRGDQAGERHQI